MSALIEQQDGTRGVLPVDVRRRRAPFALTPLADIMFQLLIFFMLSTSLAPHALMILSPPRAPSSEDTTSSVPTGSLERSAQVIWHLGRGEVRSGAARIGLDQVEDAIAQLAQDGTEVLTVIVAADAQVQDLSDLVEAIHVGGLVRVQLIGH